MTKPETGNGNNTFFLRAKCVNAMRPVQDLSENFVEPQLATTTVESALNALASDVGPQYYIVMWAVGRNRRAFMDVLEEGVEIVY